MDEREDQVNEKNWLHILAIWFVATYLVAIYIKFLFF